MDLQNPEDVTGFGVPDTVPAGPAPTVGPVPVVHAAADFAAQPHQLDFNPFGGFIGLIGGILSGLGALFGGGGGGDVSAVNDRLTKLGNFVLQAVGALTNQANYNTGAAQVDGTLWSRIFSGIFGPIVSLLSGLISGVSGDLSKLIGPLTNALGKIRDALRHIYDAWLRPILHVIDTTRQILRVLAALHLHLAAAADAALGKLEGKLTAPLLLATKKINELSNQVNRIVTLDGALQRITLVKGLVAHSACVQRSILNTWMPDPSTVPDTLSPASNESTVAELVTDYATFVQSGTSDELAGYDDWLSQLQSDVVTGG